MALTRLEAARAALAAAKKELREAEEEEERGYAAAAQAAIDAGTHVRVTHDEWDNEDDKWNSSREEYIAVVPVGLDVYFSSAYYEEDHDGSLCKWLEKGKALDGRYVWWNLGSVFHQSEAVEAERQWRASW
jgi:hypothetical protein